MYYLKCPNCGAGKRHINHIVNWGDDHWECDNCGHQWHTDDYYYDYKTKDYVSYDDDDDDDDDCYDDDDDDCTPGAYLGKGIGGILVELLFNQFNH